MLQGAAGSYFLLLARVALAFVLLILVSSLKPEKLARREPNSISWHESAAPHEWFEDWELCVMKKNASSLVTNTVHDARNCAKSKVLLQCRLGDSYARRSCILRPTNMETMPHFRMVPAGYDSPHSRFVDEIFKSLAMYNGSIVLSGDSSMNQFVKAMTCELRRHGTLSPLLPYQALYSSVNVTLDKGKVVTVPFLFHLSGLMHKQAVEGVIGKVRSHLMHQDTVLLVINAGLRYNIQQQLMDDYSIMFSELLLVAEEVEKNEGKSLMIALMESTAQHFDHPSGYFQREDQLLAEDAWQCAPIANTSWVSDWRNHMMWEHFVLGDWGKRVQEMKSVAFTVLSGRAVTEGLHDMHVRHNYHDCTHYCYTPAVHQPIYHELRALTDMLPALHAAV